MPDIFLFVIQTLNFIAVFTDVAIAVNGATSDNFLNPLSDPKLSDEFNRWYRYANAPVCICIKKYDDEYVAATTQSIPVKIANDTRLPRYPLRDTIKNSAHGERNCIFNIPTQRSWKPFYIASLCKNLDDKIFCLKMSEYFF